VFAAYNTAIWLAGSATRLDFMRPGRYGRAATGKRVILSTLGISGLERIVTSPFSCADQSGGQWLCRSFRAAGGLFPGKRDCPIIRDSGCGWISDRSWAWPHILCAVITSCWLRCRNGLMKDHYAAPCPPRYSIGMLLMTEGGLAVWLMVIRSVGVHRSSAAVLLGART
jgi:hypothetical protein